MGTGRHVLLAVLAVTFAACSLGDAVTPTCDPAAAPNSDNACIETSPCDSGNGVVVANEECCVAVGNYQYSLCLGQQFDGSFRNECTGGATDSGCCSGAQTNYDVCLQGRYPVSPQATTTSGGGATTSGGGGGAGGN